jgi:N-carbamoyl-L-amino-acid hydrolase
VFALRAEAEMLFSALDKGSRHGAGIVRDTYGRGENFAHRLIAGHAASMGLEVTTDHAANTYMTLPGRDRAAPRIVTGSHLDSVPQGGNFDGAAGVVAGLLACRVLAGLDQVRACDLTVMGVRAEESVWFAYSYVGSRAALGRLPAAALGQRRIDTARSLADHMAECGADPDAVREGRQALDPGSLRAFIELHIEQAPSLVEADMPVAIATGIPGNFRYPNAKVIGRYDHVGTPRRFRHDAVIAGARFAAGLDAIWDEHEARGCPVAITLGRFHTEASMHGLTTVPGELTFSLDVRAYEPEVLDEIERRLHDLVSRLETECRVTFVLGERASAPVGRMAAEIQAGLARAAEALGIPAVPLGSPASHDAAAFAAAGVPTGMIFVRNENGSHNPAESMTTDDFLAGTAVLTQWLAENLFRA